MRIETHGQQFEVTAALRDYAQSKLSRLADHFEQPCDIRVVLAADKPNYRAEATVTIAGKALHVEATASDMYAAIDMLTDKLDRLLLKQKEKREDQRNRAESLARSESGLS